jgi:hypothetical protein
VTNKPKIKGTSFESQCVGFLQERLNQQQIERRALHGGKDQGDVFGLVAHGASGVIECKNVKSLNPANIAKWREQTINERKHSGADFALLVIHLPGCGKARFGMNRCDLQLRDLDALSGDSFKCLMGDGMSDVWVTMTVEDVCRIIERD